MIEGNIGRTPSTSREGTRPSKIIVSFMALMVSEIRRPILSLGNRKVF